MKEKILIVDDSKVMRRIIRKELEDVGFEIYEAEDGLEAFERAREKGLDGFVKKPIKIKHINNAIQHYAG